MSQAPQKLEALSVAIGELESLWRAKKETSDQFNEACEATALKAGIETSVVKAYITARCSDKLEASELKAQQMALVFDMMA